MITLHISTYVEAVQHELAERVFDTLDVLILASARRATRFPALVLSKEEFNYLEEITKNVLYVKVPIVPPGMPDTYVLNNLPDPTEEELAQVTANAMRDHDKFCLKDHLKEVLNALKEMPLSEPEIANLEKILWAGAIITDGIYKDLTNLARSSPLQAQLHLNHNNDSIQEHMRESMAQMMENLTEAAGEVKADVPIEELLKMKLH